MSRKFWNRLAFERELWLRGILCVAGVDEAGCGPLAGPVVAAAVQFPCIWADAGLPSKFRGLNDSKQLTEEEREKFHALITGREDIRYGISVVDAEVIDQINILQAAHRAMNQALEQLDPAPQHALVDGRPVKSMRVPHTPLVKGDARSYSIAAASVLAKVTRDRIMMEYDRQYPGYGFGEHKGYGTPQHLAAIHLLGPSPIHRRSFSPLRPVELELFPEELEGVAPPKAAPSHGGPGTEPPVSAEPDLISPAALT
ncbi:MAG: Ribonuclease [Verrucomicrobiales bacterium]|nr:Ribonuclease [Verrucomicrobiales bacterium]